MKPDKFNQRPTISSSPRPDAVSNQLPSMPTEPLHPAEIAEPAKLKNKYLNKKNVIIGSTIIFVILVGLTLLLISLIGQDRQVSVHQTGDATCPSAPAYPMKTPGGVAIDKLGGWKPVCPPDSTPTYAFTDKLKGASLVVTQQKLPDDFQQSPTTRIQEIAKNYDTKLPTVNMLAYLGTNARGPQSIIATDYRLLTLIQSTATVDNDDWVKYLDSFQTIY
ncbi:MAG: hypothetical protein L0H36_00775 [bacterium]|nr:hypothetical protein [bacterium]